MSRLMRWTPMPPAGRASTGRVRSGSGYFSGSNPTPASSTATNQNAMRYVDGAPTSDTSPLRNYPSVDDTTAKTFAAEYTAQERMARYQFLANSLTVRSDRYCAYVVIRGYNSGDFSSPPAESLRFFVILDRSGVINQDSPVIAFPKTGQKN